MAFCCEGGERVSRPADGFRTVYRVRAWKGYCKNGKYKAEECFESENVKEAAAVLGRLRSERAAGKWDKVIHAVRLFDPDGVEL
jgi:hypothetical protein